MGWRLFKTATWTLIAFSITATATYCVTGSFVKAGVVALVCRAIKVPIYYFHDMLWDWLRQRRHLPIVVEDLEKEIAV